MSNNQDLAGDFPPCKVLFCIYKYAGTYCVLWEDAIENKGKSWYDK